MNIRHIHSVDWVVERALRAGFPQRAASVHARAFVGWLDVSLVIVFDEDASDADVDRVACTAVLEMDGRHWQLRGEGRDTLDRRVLLYERGIAN